ncbi:hypothetical protein [Rhodococcus sp. H29-C3]|uniref:hypothetical protein n=1 Tax=Rhodococcus sp. H29-C3 TaxID=3046307 RepID=UPI0024B9544C|nr:hypothetical protein [Rhodococcus sp. H29-C3]MDJ0363129.1 hypothetical protein [Rhodococcus sp. H29-C3]
MSVAEPPRDQRVLVIGLSPVKNEDVVASLRELGIDAVGCTEPDTAAERYDARQFKVIAFGRGALGPGAERLKHAFSDQDPRVGFVDAFGPIAVAQVAAAIQRSPGSPALVEDLTFTLHDRGGQVTATVLTTCHICVSLYHQPTQESLEKTVLLDADVAEGRMTCPLSDTNLSGAYSLVAVVNGEEFHHLPFL